MEENSEEVLEKLHLSLLEILDEIDRICRKNNIQYFLDSGTALGAIRHGGFIPWDDDADVGMIRSEYERFICAAKEELSPRFFLQNQESQPEYLQFNSKVRLNDTFFPEERNEGTFLHQGIFVDVFPFDYISDNPKQAKKDILKSRRVIRMFAIRHRHPLNESLPRKIVRGLFSIIPEKVFKDKCIKHFSKYNNTGSETLVSYAYKMNGDHFLCFKKNDLFPSKDVKFENRKYEIMNNPDTYLNTMYGDYMSLPPVEKRVWHFHGEIKFN